MSRRSKSLKVTGIGLAVLWAAMAFVAGSALAHLNHIEGTNGDDNKGGTVNADHMILYAGADLAHGNPGQDVIEMGSGFDNAEGGDQGDEIHGGDAGDKVKGNSGQDAVHGGAGGDDPVRGGEDYDNMYAGGGDDKVDALDNGPDIVYCGDGTNDEADADGAGGPPTDLVSNDCEVRRYY